MDKSMYLMFGAPLALPTEVHKKIKYSEYTCKLCGSRWFVYREKRTWKKNYICPHCLEWQV